MTKKTTKKIIGRLERISIPYFGLEDIEAKIDTGAYNGTIHVSEASEKKENGKSVLKFKILDEEHPKYEDKIYVAEEYEKKVFKNSMGSEIRYVIPVSIILKGREFQVKLALSNRKDMRYPVLIGRKIIKKHFVVDAAKKFTFKNNFNK